MMDFASHFLVNAIRKEYFDEWIEFADLPSDENFLISGADKGQGASDIQKAFCQALKNGWILDLHAIDMPWAYALLPLGKKIVDRFARKFHDIYEKYGLLEYDYPFLLPDKNFTSIFEYLGLNGKLLRVWSWADEHCWYLCPTWEEAIYPHWKKIIKKWRDLPLKIYRVARFFRPLSKNKWQVFRAMENADVFEFHCAYSSIGEQQAELLTFVEMLDSLVGAFFIPSMKLERPIWTNNSKVSHKTIAHDVLLPGWKTLQIASIYDQGQLFSIPYGIQFVHDSQTFHTHQLTGYVSRKIVLAHIFLWLTNVQSFLLPPSILPNKAAIVYRKEDGRCEHMVNWLVSALRSQIWEVAFSVAENKEFLSRQNKKNTSEMIRVQVIIFERRSDAEKHKIVILDSVRHREAVLYLETLEGLCPIIESVVKNVEIHYRNTVIDHYLDNLKFCDSKNSVKETLEQNKVSVVYLEKSERAVRALEEISPWEVIWFSTLEANSGTCVITGHEVTTLALMSRRI